MRKMIKKIISITLIISMMLSTAYTFEMEKKDVYASDNIENSTDAYSDMVFSSDNSMGKLIADKLSNSTDVQNNKGYNILDVTVTGTSAEVEFESIGDAKIIVGIYSEDGQEMQGMGTADIKQSDSKVVVNINIDTMPQYFLVRAFLIDDTMSPLCSMYESTMYTKEMQDFLSKTTDDFDKDKVLNLDSDKTNNFAVYKDDVTRVSSGASNKLVSYDDAKGEYRFSNVNSNITQLKFGDIFAYDNEGTEIIIKVDRIVVNGTDAIVYSQETSLEEVFDYVKVDDSQDVGNATVNTTDMQSGVIYNGMTDYTDDVETESVDDNSDVAVLSEPAIDLEGKYDKEASFTFNNTSIKCDDNYVEISGGLKLAANASAKVYITLNYQYVEVKLDLSIKLNLALKENIGGTIKLAELGISPCPGVYIGFTPSIIIKASVKLEVSGKLESIVGFRYGSKNGFENISTNPTFNSKVDISGEIYLGISLEPKVTILSEKISKAWMKAEAGVVLEAKVDFDRGKEGEYTHDCVSCIDGSIYAKLNVSAGVKFLEKDNLSLTVELIKIDKLPIADFYYSETFKDGGWGKCKHYKYKVHFVVINNTDDDTHDTELLIDEKDKYVLSKKNDIDIYVSNGEHNLLYSKFGYKETKRDIKIDGSTKSQYIRLIKISEGNDNRVIDVELGYNYSGAITEDGSLYMWGSNVAGELGNGTTTGSKIPQKIMDNIVSVSLGYDHAGAITEDGSLYVWGGNHSGSLGDGTNKNSYIPKKIMDNVIYVSLGTESSAAITENGDLYTWGRNNYGQLGDGTTKNKDRPQKIMDNVRSVCLGSDYCGAITNDNCLYMWGCNDYGQLGDGTRKSSSKPTKLMENIKEISLGVRYCGVIDMSGNLYMWGSNSNNQIGQNINNDGKPIKIMEKITKVDLGYGHTGALSEEGCLYMWGKNDAGQLGIEGEKNPVKVIEDVKEFSLGWEHTGALTNDGILYMWGYNYFGQIGDGTTVNRYSPVHIELSEKDIDGRSLIADKFMSDFTINNGNVYVEQKNAINLLPQAQYMIYVVKSSDTMTDILSPSNIIYINQMKTDEDGKLNLEYNSLWDDYDIIVVGEDSNIHYVDGSYVNGIKDRMVLSDLDGLINKRYIVIDGTDNTYKNDSDYIKTGDILCILDSKGNYSQSYSICIKGDIDGTGTIDVLDMEAIQKSILGIGDKLSGAYKEAASLSGGEDITVLDMEVIQKDILGIEKIN